MEEKKTAAQQLKALADAEKEFWDKQGDEEVTADQKKELDTRWKQIEDLSAKIDEESGYNARKEQLAALNAKLSQPQGRPDFGNGEPDRGGGFKSIGQQMVESPAFKQWLSVIAPEGSEVAEGLKIDSPTFETKSLIMTTPTTAGGAFVRRDYGPWPVELPLRPLTIRDVVTILQTGSNMIEYVRVTALTRGAAITPEATATTSTGYSNAAKPEAGMTFETVQAPVKTIPVWMPITRQILSDVPQLQSMIDAFLRADIELALEDEVVGGAGGANHFTGLENTTGLTPQAFVPDSLDSTGGIIGTTRRARTKVRVIGRANPTGYLLNPYDWETIDLGRATGTSNFYFGGPMAMGTKMLWGLPVVESEPVPQGTGYVGDLKQIVIWDRERGTVRTTDSHSDFFTHNLVAILAELRAAMGILRPAAIVKMDFVTGANS